MEIFAIFVSMLQSKQSIHFFKVGYNYLMIILEKKEEERNTKWYSHTWFAVVLGCAIGFINGFWGGGGGMICVPALTYLLSVPEKKAHATTIFIMLPLCIASFFIYYFKGFVQFDTKLWIITAGFVVGGVLGALLLKKINNTILQIVFAIVIIAGGIRLLF